MSAARSLISPQVEAQALQQGASTLPYDLRAEMEWVDFSCVANPLGTPQRVRDAITAAIAQGDLNFRPNADGSHLAGMLARYFEVAPGCFLAGTSASAMIGAIAQAYRPCDVGIPTPAPAQYFVSVANVGHNPVKLANPFSLSAIEPASARSNGLVFDAAILANPSYPCARMLSESTLLRYLETCSWVIVDESSINLTMGRESFAHLVQQHRNLLVIRSLSTDLGMSGIPMGYVMGHPDTIAHIRQFSDGSSLGMFHEIVAKVLPHIEDYNEETNRVLDNEIPWMQCMLSLTPGIKVYPSEANFVMCQLEERSARDFGIATAADLNTRLQKVGFTVQDLQGTPGIEGAKCFLVAIRGHEDNEAFIHNLRAIITE